MRLAIMTASAGDTKLACTALEKIIQSSSEEKSIASDLFLLLPLTETAFKEMFSFLNQHKLFDNENIIFRSMFNDLSPELINTWIKALSIEHAVIGFPSPLDETFSFEIAEQIIVPCTILYEYMYKPEEHAFFKQNWLKRISNNDCHFAIPLEAAKKDFRALNEDRLHLTGHMSIDDAISDQKADHSEDVLKTREKLGLNKNDELVFVSGTTQPHKTDIDFLRVLLKEMSDEKYSNMQLRFGLHPGVKNPDEYLERLVKVFDEYPKASLQCKVIFTPAFKDKLKPESLEYFTPEKFPVLLDTDVTGSAAEIAAPFVAQAVSGGLVNKAALSGKPALILQGIPYLPENLYTRDVATFFSGTRRNPVSKTDLSLDPEKTAADGVVSAIGRTSLACCK